MGCFKNIKEVVCSTAVLFKVWFLNWSQFVNCLLPVCYEINIEIESKNLETFVVISKSNFITAKSNNEKN